MTRDAIGAGPRTVAGVLEGRGIDTRIIPVKEFLSCTWNQNDYDTLLISGMTSDLLALQRVTRLWRKRSKGLVIIGGPAASEPERILRKTMADLTVIGEGEETLEKLVNLDFDNLKPENLLDLKGVAFKYEGRYHVNPLKPVQGRDFFKRYRPSTKRVTDYPLYYAARVYVEVLRGCSNYRRARLGPVGEKCTYCEQCTEAGLSERYDCPAGIPPGCGYCSVPSLYGPSRTRPSGLIVDEVKELLDLGVRRINLSAPGFLDYGRDLLVDPAPLTDPRNPEPNYEAIEELLRSLTSLDQVSDNTASIMVENIKASLVTDRAAELMGKYLAGTPVSLGFETGLGRHSRQLGRPDTPHEGLIALRRLKAAGLKPYVYFIHGLPGQTSTTVDETVHAINETIKVGAERIILYRFQSLPWSSFEYCPSGPPAATDPLSSRIYKAAREANIVKKRSWVGQSIRVVLAESYDRDPSLMVAYPLKHGPVVLVEGVKNRITDILDVTVIGIVSDRAIRARV